MPRGMGYLAALATLAVLSFTGTLRAQDFEGKTISEVTIRYSGSCLLYTSDAADE